MGRKKKVEEQVTLLDDIKSINYKYKGQTSIYNLVIYFKNEKEVEIVDIKATRFTKNLSARQFLDQVGSSKMIQIITKALLANKVIEKGDAFIFSTELQLAEGS